MGTFVPDGEGVVLGDAPTDSDADAVSVADPDDDAVADADDVGVTVGDVDGVTEGDGVVDAVTDGVGVADTDGNAPRPSAWYMTRSHPPSRPSYSPQR